MGCLPVVFILLLVSVSASEDQNSCAEITALITKPEKEIITFIDKLMIRLASKYQPCIDILVKNGKLEALDFYLSQLATKGIKYKEALQMSINTMKKSLDAVLDKHRFDKVEYQTVYPAFQWAQSMDDVFLEIKFAHRHDSPGCLEMRDLKVDINPGNVDFVGYCVLGDVPIKIDFHIKTWQKINPKLSSHAFGSVGKYHITLKKETPGMYWDKLLSENSTVPTNMRVWWEMRAKFEEQLKKYEEEDEEKEFNREVEEIKKQAEANSEKKVKKKRAKKKKTKKEGEKGDL